VLWLCFGDSGFLVFDPPLPACKLQYWKDSGKHCRRQPDESIVGGRCGRLGREYLIDCRHKRQRAWKYFEGKFRPRYDILLGRHVGEILRSVPRIQKGASDGGSATFPRTVRMWRYYLATSAFLLLAILVFPYYRQVC